LRTIPVLAEITTQLRHLSFRLATALPPPVAWPADSLLRPRPHDELHGEALCYPQVHQPLRQLTASESELWRLLRQPAGVAAVRERIVPLPIES
jgi:hypothetical protein